MFHYPRIALYIALFILFQPEPYDNIVLPEYQHLIDRHRIVQQAFVPDAGT